MAIIHEFCLSVSSAQSLAIRKTTASAQICDIQSKEFFEKENCINAWISMNCVKK